MTETIRVTVDDRGIGRITLTRSDRHNALSAPMIDAMTDAARRLGTDPAVRAVVLSGEGKSFCAGGDLAWMRAQFDSDRTGRVAEARRLAGLFSALDRLPKPLIAAVHGPAYGGGVGLVAVSDVAIGTPAARFALTEVRLGIIPATIAPYVVARIGAAAARRTMLTARPFDAGEALGMGLLSRVVAPDDLDDAVEEEIRCVLDTAPGAVADAKALLRSLSGGVADETVERTIEALADRWGSAEARERIAAFFDRAARR